MDEYDTVFKSRYLHGNESAFAPRSDLTDKHNYSRHVFIDRDGGISEAVRLNVLDDRHREDIIGFHFAQQYAKIYYTGQPEQPQFYIVGRDNTWDIEYVMHDGTNFFLEICRVADRDFLKAMKIENDVTSLLLKSKLAGFEIKKIEKHFPGTVPRDLLEKVRTKADMRKVFPWNNAEGLPKFFLRPPINPRLDIGKELKVSLKKKMEKKHTRKGNTIVVIDNLTTHSLPEDFFVALGRVDKRDSVVRRPMIQAHLCLGDGLGAQPDIRR